MLAHLVLSIVLTAAPSIHATPQRTFVSSAAGRQTVFTPDSSVLAVCSADGVIDLHRVPDGKLVRRIAHPDGATSVAFSADGHWLVSGGYDGTVRIWRVSDGNAVRVLRGHGGTVWSVSFSPDGRRVASAGEDKTIRVWRWSDGAQLMALTGHALNIWRVAFSPDGTLIASSSFDKTIKLWRADNGQLIRTINGHTQAVVGLAFSPNSQLLGSGSDDSTVRMWRVGDGKLLATMSGSEHVYTVAFSPDGNWLASGGRELGALGTIWKQVFDHHLIGGNGVTVRLWRVRDGAIQQRLAGHADDVRSVAFSPDGKWLATSSEDGVTNLWKLK
jgi:WD40 repeat protein